MEEKENKRGEFNGKKIKERNKNQVSTSVETLFVIDVVAATVVVERRVFQSVLLYVQNLIT